MPKRTLPDDGGFMEQVMKVYRGEDGKIRRRKTQVKMTPKADPVPPKRRAPGRKSPPRASLPPEVAATPEQQYSTDAPNFGDFSEFQFTFRARRWKVWVRRSPAYASA